jgi:putative oxidoreductase
MRASNLTTPADLAGTLLRIALGVMYLSHAWLKLHTFTLAGTADFFAKVGFAPWLAYPVTFAEAAAGLLLIAGVQVRWVALAMLPVLAGATYTHWPNGWVFINTGGGWEYPAFLAVASLAQALLGNGAYALQPGWARMQPAN